MQSTAPKWAMNSIVILSLVLFPSSYTSHCETIQAKTAFNKNNNHSTCKSDLNLRKNLAKYYPGSTAFYGAETWTFRKLDQKYLESCEM